MPNYFFVKLNPPRPTFPEDITPDELTIMQAHGAYWTEMTRKGLVVVFGVVPELGQTFGLGVFEVESEERVWELIGDDPVKKAGLGTYEVHAMRVGALRDRI